MRDHNTERPTPAMVYRMHIPFPSELDSRRSTVLLYGPEQGEKDCFVMVSGPLGIDCDKLDGEAQKMWLEKYGEDMPKDVVGTPVETLLAAFAPYPGPTPLEDSEIDFLAQAKRFCQSTNAWDGWQKNLTLDLVLLMREGLGWRLGRSVPEDDPGWLAIWAEEEEDRWTMDVIRDAYGLPQLPRYTQAELDEAKVRASVIAARLRVE